MCLGEVYLISESSVNPTSKDPKNFQRKFCESQIQRYILKYIYIQSSSHTRAPFSISTSLELFTKYPLL